MENTELEKLLQRADLSKTEFSRLYRCDKVTVTRYNQSAKLSWKVKSWLLMYIELTEAQRGLIFN